MPRYDIRLVGPFELLANAESVPTRAAHRRVLSILAIPPGGEISRDHLIGELWGDHPPSTARNTLQAHISAIRRLAPGIIETTQVGYRLATGVTTDVERFLDEAAASMRWADAEDWEQAARACERARATWRGEPFWELTESTDAALVRLRLVEQHLELLERHAETRLSLGREEEVVAELEQLVTEHPLRERLWEYLMLGRYRIGRQADALRAFRAVTKILAEELGIEPGRRLRTLEEEILMQVPETRAAGVATPHNLPVLTTSFVGRDDDLDRIASAIRATPLISLVGGPGIGKSRLAVAVGWRSIADFPAGVHFVSLAGAITEEDVAAEIVTTVGSAEETADLESLAAAFAHRPMLLILDNCEQVIAAINRFCTAAFEAHGPLRILTTSRRRIGLTHEVTEPVTALATPADHETDPSTVLANPAVRLLIDRVRAHDAAFLPTGTQPAAIATLVRGTDGVPLALEMAARWIPTVGLLEFAELRRLVDDDSIDGAIELSTRLLSPEDRDLFHAASVFSGGATLRTLTAVSAPDAPAIEAAGSVSRLVESSLLSHVVDASGRMMYSMLQPVREFARRHVEKSGRLDEVTDRLVAHYRSAAPALEHEPPDAVDNAMPDLRHVLRRLIDTDDIAGAEAIACSLASYWVARYLTWEAERWFSEVLERADDAAGLETLWKAGWVAFNGNAYPSALERYAELQRRAAAAGDPRYEGRALYGRARIELPMNRPTGIDTLKSALGLLRSSGSRTDIGECLMALGFGYSWMGKPREAAGYLEEGFEIGSSEADRRLMAQCRRFQSLAAYFADDEESAVTYASDARRLAEEAHDVRVLGGARLQSALIEARWGDVAVGARYVGDALRILPAGTPIDTALVFVGAIPILVEGGEVNLASDAFGHVDAIAASRQWQPIHSVNPTVGHYRSIVGAVGPPTHPVHVTRSAVQDALDRLAARSDEVRADRARP